MLLEFGRVERFNTKGFGFVSSVFHGEVFIHISTIKEKRIRNILDENKDVKNIEPDLYFWYLLKKEEKGLTVNHIYKSLSEVSDDLVTQFSEKFVDNIELEHFDKFSGETLLNFCRDLFLDKRTSHIRHDEFTSTDFFINTPTIAFLFMNVKGINKVLKNKKSQTIDITSKSNKLGIVLNSSLSNKKILFQIPNITTHERALIAKFKKDISGLSKTYPKLAGICLECESNHVVLLSSSSGIGGWRQCEDCDSVWYSNHCWNCRTGVESRDTLIKKCEKCDWYICAQCGNCKGNCERNSP